MHIIKPLPGTLVMPGFLPAIFMLGCWPMNEVNGNIVFDLSGNRNNGAVNGAAWVGGKFGKTLSYTTDDYTGLGTLGNLGSLLGSKYVSIFCWVRSSDTANEICVIGVMNGTGYDTGIGIWLNKDKYENTAAGKIYVHIKSENNVRDKGAVSFDTGVTDGAWHYLVVIFEPGGLGNGAGVVYLDGVSLNFERVFDNFDGVTANFNVDVTLGAHNQETGGLSDFFEGEIDCPLIFVGDRPLSLSDINLLYHNPFCMFPEPNPELFLPSGAPPPPSSEQWFYYLGDRPDNTIITAA